MLHYPRLWQSSLRQVKAISHCFATAAERCDHVWSNLLGPMTFCYFRSYPNLRRLLHFHRRRRNFDHLWQQRAEQLQC